MDILIILFFGLASSFIGLCDNVIFSDARKKKLNETFDTWYRIVAKQDKIKVALLFCKKVNDILDSVFGLRHLSKRLFLKSFFISSGMLLVTIGLLSFANKQPFWTTPWKEYTDSVNFILNTTDDLDSLAHYSQFTEIEYQKSDSSSSTNFYILNYNTNYYILRYNTNGIYSSQRIEPLGHGHLVVDYGRIFYAGSTNQTTNGVGKIETAKDLMDKMVGEINQVHNYAGKLNRKSYVVIYSIAYFIVLFAANTILFVLSLAFCRTMLREVESSGKKITTLSLAFTNLVFVVGCSCFLLFFITLAAIPVFWMIIPILYQISAESISTVVVGLIVGCFALLVIIGNSTKIVLFIALLPSVFALFVILFSILAMKWRNAFHFIIVNLFIRCSQKSPFIVLGSIILFVSAGICFAAKIIHILGFL